MPTPMAHRDRDVPHRQEPAAQGARATVETVDIVARRSSRRLHKAFLRYHDADNWPLLREALKAWAAPT